MRKKIAALLAVTLVAGSVAGCASSSSTAETTTVSATTTVAETTTVKETTTVAETTTEAATTTVEAETDDIVIDDPTEEEYETADPDFNPVVGDDDDYWGSEGESDGNGEFEYIGEKLREKFLSETANSIDISSIAENIAAVSGYDCGTIEVSEGFLNGFSADIKGFSAGVMFAPWIGSVPLVGYVFLADDTDALVETLKANADPRWNICTEAAETVVEVSGNIVFFAMCPGPDEY